MLIDGEKMGWLVAVFYGLAALVLIVNMIPQASYLKLDREGFEFCSLFRKQRYNWNDVNQFWVDKISSNKMVMFDYSKKHQRAKTAREVSSMITDAEAALHDNFGMKAEDLAELMNRYKLENDKPMT